MEGSYKDNLSFYKRDNNFCIYQLLKKNVAKERSS